MKLLWFSLLFFINIQISFGNTTTPRETFRTYLKAMVNIKNQTGDTHENYEKAISTLNLKSVNSDVKFEVGKKYANLLIKALDRLKKVDYEAIPEKPELPIWYFDRRTFENQLLEIAVIKIEDKWLFTEQTIESLETYQKALKKFKLAEGVTAFSTLADSAREKLGEKWTKKSFIFENWQWLGLFLALIFAFILEKISKAIISEILRHTSKVVKATGDEKLSHAINPLAKIIFVGIMMGLVTLMDFSPRVIAVIHRTLYIALSLMTVWFAHTVIEYLAERFKERASQTTTKFDDILIPLLTKTAFVIIYLLGGLLVANSLTIDVTGIIAGLGIGGLAFAFAAKDTLANFFGSIMLVLDRPFDIGDVITAGDIEGVVSEVGFRSTRIRTFNDSLITISNGELMNRPIDNKGKRRFRRLVTNLGLEYSTPPEKIEAFCEGVRQLIVSHKFTRKDNFHVYFNNYGASSLDVKLVVYWITSDYSRELAEQHRLLLDILRLAKEIGVEFAFPTQTVHMFQEEKVAQEVIDDSRKTFHAAQEKAKNVLNKPMALKNPRSNAEDKEQFGENEFGND